MLTFKEYISESLDTPYNWSWKKVSANYLSASATTKDGGKLLVEFEEFEDEWEVQFDYNGSMQLTNAQDPLRVFATVLNIIKAFIAKKQDSIKELFFSASKTKEQGNRSPLYKRLVKKYIPNNWAIITKEFKDFTQFYLYPQKE